MGWTESSIDDVKRAADIDRVIARDTPVVKEGSTLRARCQLPGHSDKHPSVNITVKEGLWFCPVCNVGGDGVAWIMKTSAATYPEAMRKLSELSGIELVEEGAEAVAARPVQRVVAQWSYQDEGGNPIYNVQRLEPGRNGKAKEYRQVGGKHPRQVLYHMPEVIAAVARGDVVYVVEGEKTADALRELGLCATTWAGGSSAATETWTEAFAEPLRRARVAILADNDEAGRKAMRAVMGLLVFGGITKQAVVVDLGHEEKGDDVVDWLEEGGTKRELIQKTAVAMGDAVPSEALEVSSDTWDDEVALAKRDLMQAMGTTKEQQGPVGFIDADELLSRDYGETPWLIDGICTEQAVFVIGGEPKTAKTWVGVDMAIAVASATPLFGEFRSHGKGRSAWLFLCEDNDRSVQNRVRSLVMGRGPVLASWGPRLKIKTLGSMHLDNIDHLARYVATVRRSDVPPAVVAFDPLRDLHALNEDSSGEMQAVYSALRALRTVLQCAVVFVHHSGKSTADSDKRRGGQKLRGSSALHGAVDGGLYLSAPVRERDEAKRLTTMVSNVEGEVKAAAAVGDFSLTLQIFDNHKREAIRSQWTYTKLGEGIDPKMTQQLDRMKRETLAHVRRHHAKAAFVPVSVRQLRADMGLSGTKAKQLQQVLSDMVAMAELEALPGPQGAPTYRLPVGSPAPVASLPQHEPPDPDEPPEYEGDEFIDG